MEHIKRTKIIATLGPSITGNIFTLKEYENPKNALLIIKAKELLKSLILAGVDTFRFNFSHGNHEEQLVRLKMVRSVLSEYNLTTSLLLDTKGPEIRIGKLKTASVSIKINNSITLHTNDLKMEGTPKDLPIYASSKDYFMEKDVKIGDKIFIDDGKLEIIATNVDSVKHTITGVAKNSHVVKPNKRINLPDADYTMKFMSDKDIKDIKFAVDNGFDYIAASFVNTVYNVKEIRNEIEKHGGSGIQVISKIETGTAIKNIDDIIGVSDGVMVARGDLGLEIPYYEIPYWEKYIIKACRFFGRPVIVATQMLDSLETKIQPTRAEVTDVFFAVDRGADATMLSGETANGLFPLNTVQVMAKINTISEKLFDYERAYSFYFKETPFFKQSFGKVVQDIAKTVSPKKMIKNSDFTHDSIIYFGNNSEKIRALSNIRPAATIFVVTDIKEFNSYFGIYYGIKILLQEDINTALRNYQTIADDIQKKYQFKNANIIIIDDELKTLRDDIK